MYCYYDHLQTIVDDLHSKYVVLNKNIIEEFFMKNA